MKGLPQLKRVLNWKVGAATGATVTTVLVGGMFLTAELPAKEELYQKQYDTVVETLKETGFSNIELVKIEDLEYGKYYENELVETVRVEEEDWKEGFLSKTVPIQVFYHTAKPDAKILELNLDFSVEKVIDDLKKQGFQQIESTPILLPEADNLSKKDKIDSFKLGNYSYESDSFYSTALPIAITYVEVSKENIMIPKEVSSHTKKAEVEPLLKTAGFKEIKMEAVADKDDKKHDLVYEIVIDNKAYNLDNVSTRVFKLTTPIVVKYYDFSSFAKKPTEVSNKQVEEVKKLFSEQGFSDVTDEMKETTDISKHGEVESIYIDNKEFSKVKDSVLSKNSKIRIVYLNAEKAIAEENRKKEEARLAEEAQAQQFAQAPSPSVYYKNCKQARNAGVTPIYQGEPGYAPHLDRDGDGVACE